MTEALRSRFRSIHAGERLVFRTVVFRPRPAEDVLRRNGARFRGRSASMTGGSRRFRRARSFATSGPIRKQGREIQRYYLFGTLRGEACGERHRRASAGGGFGPRGAEAPQVILTFRLGIIELTLASALDFSYFGCAVDTPARQCSNKFDIALAYSYLWLAPKILRLGIIELTLASVLDFSYL